MPTACTQASFAFHPLAGRGIRARLDGGAITTDAGGLLLREVEKRTGIVEPFAACGTDHRHPERLEPTVEELVAQRIEGLALGEEDRNDHDQLRHDPLLAVLVERDAESVLASQSTRNRWELTGAEVTAAARYQKIAWDQAAVDRMLVEVFLQAHAAPPREIVLDLDATDDPLHGQQQGRFVHGDYGPSGSLPRYLFCAESLRCARGEMENRSQELLLLFADRTSTAWLRSNPIRRYVSSVA